jgi:hypothetical protein
VPVDGFGRGDGSDESERAVRPAACRSAEHPDRRPWPVAAKKERIHLMKLSEALCDYIHVPQVRFRTLVEEG